MQTVWVWVSSTRDLQRPWCVPFTSADTTPTRLPGTPVPTLSLRRPPRERVPQLPGGPVDEVATRPRRRRGCRRRRRRRVGIAATTRSVSLVTDEQRHGEADTAEVHPDHLDAEQFLAEVGPGASGGGNDAPPATFEGGLHRGGQVVVPGGLVGFGVNPRHGCAELLQLALCGVAVDAGFSGPGDFAEQAEEPPRPLSPSASSSS